MRHGWTILAFLAVAGCRQAPAPQPETQEAERLMSGCAETERLLGQMRAAEPRFRYDASGNATVTQPMWDALPPAMREGLAQAIAYHAVCEAGELRAQPVTIRSSETNEILMEETIAEFDR